MDESVDDSIDVPAAVVCAFCGDAECPGCVGERSRSGIVSLVPWERPAQPILARLWSTARAATIDGSAFFALLPDGPILPALRFAVLAELLASIGFVAVALPFVVTFAPGWVRHVVVDADARATMLRVMVLAVPGLAAMLVGAHAAHGMALDRGARGVGARGARGRAIRFGLYATGWDLVGGPIGAVVLAFREGLGGLVALVRAGSGLPGRCARAFLRGAYRLEGDRAEKANASGTVAAIVATLLGAMVVLAIGIVLALV